MNRANYSSFNTLSSNINKIPKKKLNVIWYMLGTVIIIFILLLIVLTLNYLFTDCYESKGFGQYLSDFDFKPCISKYKPDSYKERKIEDEKEVYHIANQDYTYKQAKCKCAVYGGRLATEAELANAYNNGANWCSYGWVKSADGKSRAYYPIQQDFWNRIQNDESLGLKDQCGVPGINGGVFDKDVLFGVNCYGVKREPTTQESELTASLTSGDIADEQLSKYKAELTDTIFAPFAPGKWSGL